MWKYHFLAGFLLFAALLCLPAQVQAQLQAFIMPENGFLRVEGELAITPTSPLFSFRLFPEAQITLLWTEGIADYTVERGVLGTLVTVRLNDYGSERILYLGYEGFLNFGLDDPLVLGRDVLWFPEFSIPTADPELELSFPADWHLVDTPPTLGYPTLILTRHPDWDWDLELALQQVEPSQPAPQQAPVQAPPALPPASHAEPPRPTVALTVVPDAQHEEVSNFILRLDKAISQRDAGQLAQLVGPKLQADGLIDYFASVPQQILPIESQIKNLVVQGGQADVEATMFSQGQPLYDTKMRWAQDGLGQWVLTEFNMHPHVPPAPEALVNSLHEFVAQLQQAVAADRAPDVEGVLGMEDARQRQQVMDFLMKLNTTQRWQVFVVEPQEFRLLILVHHSPRTQVLVNLELAPDPTGWRIAAFEALPLN